MKTLKYKQLLMVVAGLLLILFVVKAIFFFTEKPVMTVDYVAQYNQLTRPQNGDPSENAALSYQKAFDAFVEMPDELLPIEKQDDFNEQEKVLLKNWLASNATAFEYFKEAVDTPYYWLERVPLAIPPRMGDFMVPELNAHRNLAKALVWNARLNAANGHFQTAFEDLLACYRSGNHKCRPDLLLFEQYLGLRLKRTATENSFLLIDKYKVENSSLKYLQDTSQTQSETNPYVPSLQTERFSAYDVLQRTFIDNGKGTGRLAWSAGWMVSLLATEGSPLFTKYKDTKRRLYLCLFGPTRNDMSNKIEEIITLCDRMMNKTPWQVKQEGFDYFDAIRKIENSHILFVNLITNPKNIWHEYYKTTAQTDALITVLSILRYKYDTGQLPESLEKLVAAGYLKSVPNDPYSAGSLIYTLTDDGFKLYSVGEDFTDDGGVIKEDEVIRKELSINVHTPDIVYWPIEIIEPEPVDLRMGGPYR